MSTEGNIEVVGTKVPLLKKERSRAVANNSHLTKLEKDITTSLNNFEPGNLFHTSKAKSFKSNILEQ